MTRWRALARHQRLRTRLLVAILGVALGVLVVAILGAATIARETATEAAVHDLEHDAPTVSEDLATLTREYQRTTRAGNQGTALCRLITSTLRISNGTVVTVTAGGSVEAGLGTLLDSCAASGPLLRLPRGLPISALDTARLLDGRTQTGTSGDTAFVADPLPLIGGRQPVLLLTREVESRPLGRAGGFVIVTGGIALLVAALVAALLARRLTRPIAAMQATADRIAAGDLSARVDLQSMPNDELGRLAARIDAMADQLEAARGHERAFLLSVSHDLRTPLTSIKGYAEAMADGTVDSPEDRARAAAVIAGETRRLERLVADLLDLARLDAHQFSLDRQTVDARSVVGATVQGFEPMAREWGVQLELGPGGPLALDTDPERLGQIVANLVENALKYADHSVVVGVVLQDGDVEVRVDDDGPGIPPDVRDRVFERLYTARGTNGRTVGTGIGLAIVHELAVAMGGDASCQSLDGRGTRFVVRLPT